MRASLQKRLQFFSIISRFCEDLGRLRRSGHISSQVALVKSTHILVSSRLIPFHAMIVISTLEIENYTLIEVYRKRFCAFATYKQLSCRFCFYFGKIHPYQLWFHT